MATPERVAGFVQMAEFAEASEEQLSHASRIKYLINHQASTNLVILGN